MADIILRMDSPEKPLNPLVRVLKQVSGVKAVHIDPDIGQAAVSYDPLKVDTFELVTAVQDAGYIVQTQTIPLVVGGMSCASCAFHVETALTDVPGVVTAEVDLPTGGTTVVVTDEAMNMGRLHQAVIKAGYRIRRLEKI